MFNRRMLIAAVAAAAVLSGAPVSAQDKSIVVASTTSTQDSGLFEYLLPIFTKMTGIAVKVVAQGTGQALDTGRRGDADVVFVHAKAAEEEFVKEGAGVERKEVMYNDFVIVGRGDDSGTHKAELALWKQAGIEPSGDWYRSLGTGMGPTLNTSAQMPAYTLT